MENKITEFSKQDVESISKEINEALKAVAQKYNIQIKTNGGKYDKDTATLKLELQTITESGQILTKEASAFKQYAHLLNLKPEDLFKEFTVNNEKYVLVGYAPRKSKFPMICRKVSNNQSYGLALETVVKVLNK